MDRYAKMFARLDTENCGAFVPFVVIGDPNLADSLEIIQCLIDSGADALELGFPFSDPLADGPTIQAAMTRALDSGTTPQSCFELLTSVRNRNPQIPIGLLIYANLVANNGLDTFYKKCHASGVDSVLVADVPVNESQPFRQAALDNDIQPILLCPPNIDSQTLQLVAKHGRGYTYLLSRVGVTGTDVSAESPVKQLLVQLEENGAPPPLLGFGISQPEHVADAVACGAQGVICGSAIIEQVQKNLPHAEKACAALGEFIVRMKSATRYNH